MNKLTSHFELFSKECKFIFVKNSDVTNIKTLLSFIFTLKTYSMPRLDDFWGRDVTRVLQYDRFLAAC